MSQHSEDRLEQPAPDPAEAQSATILPFEPRQSELQRAIQQRAQQTLDVERSRDREAKKPAPLRWAIVLLIAMIPVVMLLGAVDAFLRVFHKVNEIYSAPTVQQEQAEEPLQSQPGVVMLQPIPEPAQSDGSQPSSQPSSQP